MLTKEDFKSSKNIEQFFSVLFQFSIYSYKYYFFNRELQNHGAFGTVDHLHRYWILCIEIISMQDRFNLPKIF